MDVACGSYNSRLRLVSMNRSDPGRHSSAVTPSRRRKSHLRCSRLSSVFSSYRHPEYKMQIYVLTLSILNDVQVEFISRTLGCRRIVVFPLHLWRRNEASLITPSHALSVLRHGTCGKSPLAGDGGHADNSRGASVSPAHVETLLIMLGSESVRRDHLVLTAL